MTLIHVVYGLIIGGIVGFSIGFLITADDIEFVAENFSTFDCAKNYDKWRTFQENKLVSHNDWPYSYFELMENRCFITVKSWAHDSDYEKLIWADDWKKISFMNQMYLGEVTCDTEECKTYQEQRNDYWDYLKSQE